MLVLNRADNALLIAPPLLFTLAWRTRWRDLAATALGVLPFLLWECFALFFYGSLVPNTAYAKLNTGIPRVDLVEQGLWYFADSLCRDPVTLLVIALAIVMAAVAKDGRSKSVAVGIALYLSYVAWIGGDFMSGRFFSLPFVGAIEPACRSSPIDQSGSSPGSRHADPWAGHALFATTKRGRLR